MDLCLECLIVRLVAVFPLRLAFVDLSGEGKLGIDLLFDRLMGHFDGLQHFLLRNLLHFPLDHHNALGSTADHHVHIGRFELFYCWVDNESAVDARYAHFTHGAIEWDVRNRDGGRRSKTGERIPFVAVVIGDQVDDHLCL